MKKSKILLTILLMGVATIVAIPFFKDCKKEIKQQTKQDETEKHIEEKVNEKKRNIVQELSMENEDVVGFIEIPDTTIKYSVMQTKDDPDFYLNHDLSRNYNFNSTPYLSAYCDLESSDNLIIYGHNINGGRMFGALTQYKEKDFFDKHKKIYFTTNQKDIYEIFAVMSVNKNDFAYWRFIMAKDKKDFDEFIRMVESYSFYTTNKFPKYGEKIITLSTCDNTRGNEYRFVVVGKKM